ncbi:MAG: hypothetical protein IJS60_01865 [Abditibacteriota bacterium]|nr:hypothetical protein [Abditibacteriota bacterium]
MKKLLFILVIIFLSLSSFAGRLIEADDSNLLFIDTIDGTKIGMGSFINISPKGVCFGVIQKMSKDKSMSFLATFGSVDEVHFIDVVKDENGDFIVLGVASEGSFGEGDLKGIKSYGDDDIIFIRYDKSLKVKDVQKFGSDAKDYASQIIRTSSGKFVIVGRTTLKDGIKSNAFIASLDKNFKLENIFEFKGSFDKNKDADRTDFYKVIENKEHDFLVLGNTIDGGNSTEEKTFIIKLSKNFNVKDKRAYGLKNNIIRLTDIVEFPQGGYLTVGWTTGDKQKGYVMELTPGLNKLSSFDFMPTYDRVQALHNSLYAIEPYNNYRAYIISGVAVWSKGESSDYYTLYLPYDGFKDLALYPKLKGKSHFLDNNILYVAGYDEEDRLVFVSLGE